MDWSTLGLGFIAGFLAAVAMLRRRLSGRRAPMFAAVELNRSPEPRRLSRQDLAQVRDLACAGDLTQAINLYRLLSGADLRSAHDYVTLLTRS